MVRLMVILGWVISKPLTLLMDPFESLVLYLSGELNHDLCLSPSKLT